MLVRLFVIQSAGKNILWTAAMVCWHHQKYLIVSYAALLQIRVELERIQTVSVVKVKLGRAQNNENVVDIVQG